MCGIAGLLSAAPEPLGDTARAMADALAHRGPDGAGVWTDPSGRVALAHRRLAVQDLSEAGAQPMRSASGRLTISYNGEIFSAPEIARDLAGRGIGLRGRSDTEAVLEAIAADGLEATLPRLVGQFALALWDAEAGRLTLLRDRFGIKPLYWTVGAGRLAFASEIGGLLPALGARPALCPDAVALYLRLGYVPAPLSIYREIHQLEPGTLLEIRPGRPPQIRRWYDIAARAAAIGPRIADPDEADRAVEDALREAVRCRLLADVPVGVFLSGGVDSSLVAALAVETSKTPVRTFSIGLDRPDYDESPAAARVAAHLGTEHTALRIGEAEARALVPHLPRLCGEPFADSSILPMLALSRLARGQVTVALSGDGGDEGFAGYERYRWWVRTRSLRARPWAARALAAAVEAVPDGLADRLGARLGIAGAGRRAHKLAALLRAEGPADGLARLTTYWSGGGQTAAETRLAGLDLSIFSEVETLQLQDVVGYLPGDILTKIDRAPMSVALETRVPFLDHRVVETAFRIAPELKLRRGTGKWLLRRMLARRLPETARPTAKRGFAVPIERWLRAGLKDWGASLIAETDWEGRFGFPPVAAQTAWSAHQKGASAGTDALWTLLMLAAWDADAGAGRLRPPGRGRPDGP
ncbi:MAG: asparagine synthase (glutamine-hydrolyzing) [Paracoccaceae bacterium]